MKGTVKKFDKEKGYGFITGEDGKDYFFHYSQLMMEGFKTAEVGQKVDYEAASTFLLFHLASLKQEPPTNSLMMELHGISSISIGRK